MDIKYRQVGQKLQKLNYQWPGSTSHSPLRQTRQRFCWEIRVKRAAPWKLEEKRSSQRVFACERTEKKRDSIGKLWTLIQLDWSLCYNYILLLHLLYFPCDITCFLFSCTCYSIESTTDPARGEWQKEGDQEM